MSKSSETLGVDVRQGLILGHGNGLYTAADWVTPPMRNIPLEREGHTVTILADTVDDEGRVWTAYELGIDLSTIGDRLDGESAKAVETLFSGARAAIARLAIVAHGNPESLKGQAGYQALYPDANPLL